MSKLITVSDPHGNVVHFREDDHKYFDDQQNNYNSVTKVIHSLFPEFEADKIAYFVARKRVKERGGYETNADVPVRETMQEKTVVLEEWELNKNQACDMGTQVHRYCECKLLGIEPDMEITSEKGRDMTKVVDLFLIDLEKQYEFLESEKIIFRRPYLLAGCVDLIMRNRTTGKLCIFDHKTNKEIKLKDSYKKTGKLFLQHIENCNYQTYTLQLSLYKYMLIDGGYGDFEDCELGIFHYSTRNTTCYKLNDLQLEASQIVKYAERLKGKM